MTPSEQVIVPKMDKKIAFYQVMDQEGNPYWNLVKETDLSKSLPKEAYINDAVLDFRGRLWFTTSMGIVGYADESEEEIETYSFPEGLQNQLAIDSTGVYVLTNEYMNKLIVNNDGKIKLKWRSSYDNRAGLNGLVGSGSGTSPTLFGKNDDLIAIADNGIPQMHMNVYHRDDGRLICSLPVFGEEETGCENSLIGYGNDVVIENNGGFKLFFGDPQDTQTGLIRIHVHEDLSDAEIVWENYDLKASTTPALSTANGIIYSYCVKKGSKGSNAWFLSMVDWETGKTVYEYWVGSGKDFPDMLQPVVIYDGTFYIGTKTGLLSIRDN
jgi:outer membrane protein assembly factor BamB